MDGFGMSKTLPYQELQDVLDRLNRIMASRLRAKEAEYGPYSPGSGSVTHFDLAERHFLDLKLAMMQSDRGEWDEDEIIKESADIVNHILMALYEMELEGSEIE